MTRSGISLEQKAAWMRERHSPVMAPPIASALFSERHYSVAEVAQMWSFSLDAVRRLFHDEPGVLVLGDKGSKHKRRYTTLRIPESVLQRVHRRLSNV